MDARSRVISNLQRRGYDSARELLSNIFANGDISVIQRAKLANELDSLQMLPDQDRQKKINSMRRT